MSPRKPLYNKNSLRHHHPRALGQLLTTAPPRHHSMAVSHVISCHLIPFVKPDTHRDTHNTHTHTHTHACSSPTTTTLNPNIPDTTTSQPIPKHPLP